MPHMESPQQILSNFLYIFFNFRERTHKWWSGGETEREREREREREPQAGLKLSAEPDLGLNVGLNPGLDPMTLGSWSEPKSRVRCSINWATQVPLKLFLKT